MLRWCNHRHTFYKKWIKEPGYWHFWSVISCLHRRAISMFNMTYIIELMLEFRGYDVREISNEASTSAPTQATIKWKVIHRPSIINHQRLTSPCFSVTGSPKWRCISQTWRCISQTWVLIYLTWRWRLRL